MTKLFFFFLCAILYSEAVAAQNNIILSLMYKNFTNHKGALADGTCCDEPGRSAPACTRNLCDTKFLPCATYIGEADCQAHSNASTATMFDVDSFVLQRTIGNTPGQPTSFATVVSVGTYSPKPIAFTILAKEVTGNIETAIANFSFVINWIDTFYDPNLHWRQLTLTDAFCELNVEVGHQCAPQYFGPTCSTVCFPSSQYTCLSDGTKNCTGTMQGPDCDQMFPNCTSDPCQNNGSCANTNAGYICSCPPDYSGENCEQNMASSIITSGQGVTVFNTSGKTVSMSTSSSESGHKITTLATSIAAGIFMLGIVTTAVYITYRKKKLKGRDQVNPAGSASPVSQAETLFIK